MLAALHKLSCNFLDVQPGFASAKTLRGGSQGNSALVLSFSTLSKTLINSAEAARPKAFFQSPVFSFPDHQDVCMLLFVGEILSKLIERPVHVFLFAAEKMPAGFRMVSARVVFQFGGRVRDGINGNREN